MIFVVIYFEMDGNKKKVSIIKIETFFCDPAGARTQDPNIKSVVLYQLSYWIILVCYLKVPLQMRVQSYDIFLI